MYNINIIIYIRLFYIYNTIIITYMIIDNYKQMNKIKTKMEYLICKYIYIITV